jgi:hypothetical protein
MHEQIKQTHASTQYSQHIIYNYDPLVDGVWYSPPLESVQYQVALIVTGAINKTSYEKLLLELG